MGFVSCVDIYSFIAANAVVSVGLWHSHGLCNSSSSTQAAGLKTDDLVCVVIHEPHNGELGAKGSI